MILAKKVRLKPTLEQEIQLIKSVGTARWVYNWTLEKQRENYESGESFISDNDLRKELTKLKQNEEYDWLYEVSNNVAKQAIKDACIALKNFFAGRAGFPRFKSKRKSKPSFYNDNMKLKSKGKKVLLEKIGWVIASEPIPKEVKYTNPRNDGKYWVFAVGTEVELEEIELTDEVLGVDVGIKELAVCSNGMKFKNINKTKEVKKAEKRLRRLQRKVSRKYTMNKKGDTFVKTSNIKKLEKQIKLVNRRLNGIRNNHIHQTTNAIVKTKPVEVVMETLNIKGMMKNRHLSKAIAKQKLHDFKVKLQYKCEKNGIKFSQADMWFPSSKTCSACGSIRKDLKLSERVFKCDCGIEIDRDLNASINLSKYLSACDAQAGKSVA